MTQQPSDPFALLLKASRSRREVLGTAARGAVGGLGAALIARGAGSDLFGGGASSAALAQDASVSILDNRFDPPELTATVGSTVTWTNNGGSGHNVTATPDPTVFFSPTLGPTMTFAHTFDTAGEFDYFCTIHGMSMSGTIIVEGGTPGPAKTYVRPNVNLLDPDGPELRAYALAVQKMQALPVENPTSWLYQAYMHWMPDADRQALFEASGLSEAEWEMLLSDRAWLTCEHRNLFFWPWHRMYLYWFETIVRHLGEYPDFALPYWDYSNPAQRTLPAPFRTAGNPLFVGLRDPGVNAGTAPVFSPNLEASIFDVCPGLASNGFTAASPTLEGTPHDQVHLWVGGRYANPQVQGLMRSVATSAQDPVFWLHHANLDRLWASWRAIRPQNTDPTNMTWLENATSAARGYPYGFFDQTGTKVMNFRVVKEVLDTVMNLGYEYQELADLSGCPDFLLASPSPEAAAPPPAATPQAPLELGSNAPEDEIGLGVAPTTVTIPVDQPGAALEAAAGGGHVVLTLSGVQAAESPGVLFQVYINLPQGQEPDARSPYYAGAVSLFGLEPGDDSPHRGHMAMQQFDISRNVEALESRGEWTGDVEVTFVTIPGIAEPGVEAAATPFAEPESPWVTIESVSLGVQ